eukprot:21488-Eustigmatos_ZCMA.PRE.1
MAHCTTQQWQPAAQYDPHLIAVLKDGDRVDDFDLTLRDLGGDLQGLEERGLAGVATRGTRRHNH